MKLSGQFGSGLEVTDFGRRVTILDKNNKLITYVGENPGLKKWAENKVPREDWMDGQFISPHSACWDSKGDLYVMDWLALGRISKLRRLA